MRKPTAISTLKKNDGSYTTDLGVIMNYIMDHFAPADDDKADTDLHKQIRRRTQQSPNTEDDRPFTRNEIKSIIDNMDSGKAPGEDGITSDIFRQIFTIAPKYITDMYKKCLETGHFP